MADLCIATTNKGKFQEISSYLKSAHPNLRICSLDDFTNHPRVEENGSTFLENAEKKAKVIAAFSQVPSLADDSGLEVDALGGRPGVFSARFAGLHATDRENNEKLLEKMKNTPENQRGAKFKCAMVLYAPNGLSCTAIGELKGMILSEPRGQSGFGYDPVFYIPDLNRTAAELTLSEKNAISHRAKALTKISTHIPAFYEKLKQSR